MRKHNKTKRLFALLLATVFSVTAIGIHPAFTVEAEAQPKATVQNANVQLTRNGEAMYRKGLLIDDEVYVHLYLFTRNFVSTTYTYSGNTIIVTGKGINISATVGQPYIFANDRVLFSNKNNLLIDGAVVVPLSALAQALGLHTERIGDSKVALTGYYRPILHANDFYKEDEVYWLSKIISAESKGEPLFGQIAVGRVVLNRVRSSQFPNTIYSVIFDKKYGVQFTPTANGTIYQSPYAISVIAAKIALEGYDMGNILYFYHPAYPGQTNWISNNRPYAFTINGHQFYY